MFRTATWLAVGLVTFASAIGADAPGNGNGKLDRADVEVLVRQLGDSSFQVRSAALKRLELVGPESLPLLREALKQATDVEVRRRLEDVIPGLERRGALAPTVVTLTAEKKQLRELIKDLSAQCGYRLELPASGDDRERRLISVEFKETPFWQALDQLCELGGLVYQEGYYGGDNETVRLDYGDTTPGITCLSGPFRVTVRQLEYYRRVDYSNRQRQIVEAPMRRNETLSIHLGISVEPKLPLLNTSGINISEAVDELGQSMQLPSAPGSNSVRYYSGGYRSFMAQVQCQLLPSQNGKTIKVIKGSIPVTVVSAQRPKIVVDGLTEVKSKTFKEGNASMTIDSVNKNGSQYAIKLTLTDGATNGQRDWSWVNSLNQRIVVVDAKGQKLQCYGTNWDGNGFNGNTFNGTITFGPSGGSGEPVRLTYYEWSTMAHSVPFEFKDLMLP